MAILETEGRHLETYPETSKRPAPGLLIFVTFLGGISRNGRIELGGQEKLNDDPLPRQLDRHPAESLGVGVEAGRGGQI